MSSVAFAFSPISKCNRASTFRLLRFYGYIHLYLEASFQHFKFHFVLCVFGGYLYVANYSWLLVNIGYLKVMKENFRNI